MGSAESRSELTRAFAAYGPDDLYFGDDEQPQHQRVASRSRSIWPLQK